MSVATTAPSNGDTVASPVTVSCAYSIDADCTIISSVGQGYDNGKQVTYSPPPPCDGGSDSDPITVNVLYNTVCGVTVNAGNEGFDSSVSVTVTASGTPAPVGGIEVAQTEKGGGPGAGNKPKYKVSGNVAAASTAVYVVCQAIEIVVGNQTTRTVVAAAADTINPANNKWQVMLAFTKNAGASYVARAFAYDMNQTLLGSSTKPI